MGKQERLKQLGKRVQILRQQKNLSQTDLAYRINKDQQSIQRLESGNVNPSFEYLYEICTGLNISLKDLFDFELEK